MELKRGFGNLTVDRRTIFEAFLLDRLPPKIAVHTQPDEVNNSTRQKSSRSGTGLCKLDMHEGYSATAGRNLEARTPGTGGLATKLRGCGPNDYSALYCSSIALELICTAI
jgi:hypothetical protein